MTASKNVFKAATHRRSFLKTGSLGIGTAFGTALLSEPLAASDANATPITQGDIAILRFLSAVEQVESDLWIQYAELGGATDQGLSPIDLELNARK